MKTPETLARQFNVLKETSLLLSRSAPLLLLIAAVITAPSILNYQPVLAQGTSDTTPPDTTIISSVDGTGKPVTSKGITSSNSITYTYRGTDNAGSVSNFQCSLDGKPFANCGSQVNYPGLADGGHSFSVVAIDSSGNVDKSPAFFTWVVNPSPDPKAADPKVTQRAEINTGLESGQRSLQADGPCDADYCVTEGQTLTITYTCSSGPDPRPRVECVIISGLPPGAEFQSTEGNPATGILTWANAGPPGTYQVVSQTQHTFCPEDLEFCEDSERVTTTIIVSEDCPGNLVRTSLGCVPPSIPARQTPGACGRGGGSDPSHCPTEQINGYVELARTVCQTEDIVRLYACLLTIIPSPFISTVLGILGHPSPPASFIPPGLFGK